ncbi:MAG: hypothetical protein LBS24_08535 [Clostridiales Family XIII bacterium]|jgi:hypothetical protein|nr:hypothetical protein [Clostridiales Family XIII bacterium]
MADPFPAAKHAAQHGAGKSGENRSFVRAPEYRREQVGNKTGRDERARRAAQQTEPSGKDVQEDVSPRSRREIGRFFV